jgi:predicted nucleic acid-binding Zn ribbon protein
VNRQPRRPSRTDASIADRKVNARDRDERVYARKRASAARKRAAAERAAYDPAPPDPDDWTVEDEDTGALQRVTGPSPIGASLETFIRRRGWAERVRTGAAWARWEEIVGPELARHCEPVRVAGGVLVVRAVSPTWAAQLRYLIPHLQANADQLLGTGTVRSVRLVVGPLEGSTVSDLTRAVDDGEQRPPELGS